MLVNTVVYNKQEGQLCAQHALNSLLQEPLFTAIDLAEIARELDMLSQDATELNCEGNHDDSGYFSIQVIYKALEIMGLELAGLGSEGAREAKAKPENQLAFICNLNSHWFTLRRFGESSHRWYNLNSTQSEPEYVSETFLSLLITQFVNEGYSVFVIRGQIAESEADMQARLLPVPPKDAMVKRTKHTVSKKRVSDYDEDFEKAMAMSMGQEEGQSSLDHCDKTLNAALQRSMQECDNESQFKPIAVNQPRTKDSLNLLTTHLSSPTPIQVEKTLEKELTLDEIRTKRMKMFESKQ